MKKFISLFLAAGIALPLFAQVKSPELSKASTRKVKDVVIYDESNFEMQ